MRRRTVSGIGACMHQEVPQRHNTRQAISHSLGTDASAHGSDEQQAPGLPARWDEHEPPGFMQHWDLAGVETQLDAPPPQPPLYTRSPSLPGAGLGGRGNDSRPSRDMGEVSEESTSLTQQLGLGTRVSDSPARHHGEHLGVQGTHVYNYLGWRKLWTGLLTYNTHVPVRQLLYARCCNQELKL